MKTQTLIDRSAPRSARAGLRRLLPPLVLAGLGLIAACVRFAGVVHYVPNDNPQGYFVAHSAAASSGATNRFLVGYERSGEHAPELQLYEGSVLRARYVPRYQLPVSSGRPGALASDPRDGGRFYATVSDVEKQVVFPLRYTDGHLDLDGKIAPLVGKMYGEGGGVWYPESICGMGVSQQGHVYFTSIWKEYREPADKDDPPVPTGRRQAALYQSCVGNEPPSTNVYRERFTFLPGSACYRLAIDRGLANPIFYVAQEGGAQVQAYQQRTSGSLVPAPDLDYNIGEGSIIDIAAHRGLIAVGASGGAQRRIDLAVTGLRRDQLLLGPDDRILALAAFDRPAEGGCDGRDGGYLLHVGGHWIPDPRPDGSYYLASRRMLCAAP